MRRDLFECVCLAFAAMLVLVSLGFPRGCISGATENSAKPPSSELREQRKSLQKSCENLMLVRLLVEAELRKAEKKNGTRPKANKTRRDGSDSNMGRD